MTTIKDRSKSNLVPDKMIEIALDRKERLSNNLIYKYGWQAIKNCSGMRIEFEEEDKRWKQIGIPRRNSKIEVIKGENGKFNKYMIYQIKRLEKHIDRGENYFSIVKKLIKHSKAFQISAITRIMPHSYCMNESKVNMILSKFKQLTRNNNCILQTKRVYIPKKDNQYRKLGVPTTEWRIYLHMWNNFLFQYLRRNLLKSQHGFIKGRGNNSAWRDVFKKVIPARNIYECDLKNFFPSIEHQAVCLQLMLARIPNDLIMWLDKINCIVPKLPKKQLANESDEEARLKIWNRSSKKIGKVITKMYSGTSFGVAQGAPTSPLLAILPLRDFLRQAPSISYADDPIFYSEEDLEISGDEGNGIIIHEGKSQHVKRNNQWLTDLKYLGLKYNPDTYSLSGNTRKSSRLELTYNHMIKMLDTFGYRTSSSPLKNWKIFAKSKLWNPVLSRLYNGKWTEEYIRPNYPTIDQNSWLVRKNERIQDITVSTKYVTHIYRSLRCPISKIQEV